MPQVPLTHCLDCGYSLTGLPSCHSCPECGFEYDGHTVVWKPPLAVRRRFFGVLALSALGMLPLLVCYLVYGAPVFQKRSLNILAHSCPFACIFYFIGTTALTYRVSKLQQYVAVCRSGIKARSLFRSVLIPWSDVVRVEPRSAGLATLVCRTRRSQRIARRILHFAPPIAPGAESDEFRRIVQVALDRQRASATDSPCDPNSSAGLGVA